ncbi:MAG TPA: MmcQ/YjbR family DNA-binding protein [Allosphingosinicella sp.]|nr:MmcQ/YjbR family DNA-binding protein [Allosphingosinicella sp.]
MATPDDFRRIALAFPGAEEKAHMAHPDFRVGGRIFATLGVPGRDWGMVALLPEEQELTIAAEPEAFSPAAGAWGRRGATLVKLEAVSQEWLARTLEWAWRRRARRTARPRNRPSD